MTSEVPKLSQNEYKHKSGKYFREGDQVMVDNRKGTIKTDNRYGTYFVQFDDDNTTEIHNRSDINPAWEEDENGMWNT